MKKNRILGLASAIALLAAGACSNEMIDPNTSKEGQLTTGDGTSGVYMTVDFVMPSGANGTRSKTTDPDKDNGSTTSNGGTEVGTDAENYVSSALIVIASSEEKRTQNQTVISKYGFIVAGEVPGNRIHTFTAPTGEGTNKQYRAIAQIQKENLNSLYNLYEVRDNEGKLTGYNVPEMYVFVFCNPTKDLLDVFDGTTTAFGSDSWLDATCEVIQDVDQTKNKNVGIWSANSFLMNNVNLTTRELPKHLLDWEYYSTVNTPFQLSGTNSVAGVDEPVDNSKTTDHPKRGSVLVERSVARFDFKDGSEMGDNRYAVLKYINAEGDIDEAHPIVDIQIQKMSLVNMSNKFYYLPRVSDNGLPTGEHFNYCSPELPWIAEGHEYIGGNYVVGPYADAFKSSNISSGFENYMNYPFFNNNGSFNNEQSSTTRWDVVKVDDVIKNGADDQYTGAEGNQTPGQYKVWRYVTENVIPAPEENQVNGISTGIVFKGKLFGHKDLDLSTLEDQNWEEGNIENLTNCLNGKPFTYNKQENRELTGNSSEDPILYYIDGRLYFGWKHLRQAAIQASITLNANGQPEINVSNSLYKAVFGDGPIPSYTKDGEEHYMVYMDEDGKRVEINDPRWEAIKAEAAGYTTPIASNVLDNIENSDLLGYLQSANFAWQQWSADNEQGDDATGPDASAKLAAMRSAVTGAGITIYQSSFDSDNGPGYYCYYYYWNRHNDNGMNGVMGPMEFAVVRNNVYKLSIDKIARLGHPRIPENDPENPTPDTPDESDEIYLAVRVQIAPWVVRVNNIQF